MDGEVPECEEGCRTPEQHKLHMQVQSWPKLGYSTDNSEFTGLFKKDCKICAHDHRVHRFAVPDVKCQHCPLGVCKVPTTSPYDDLPGMWERSDFE